MRLLVTALAAALALTLAGCAHDAELKETPQQIAQEQAAADAHNAGTIPFAGDDESPASSESPVTTAVPIVLGADRLFAGDCVDRPTGDAVEVHDISCSKPHHAEVTERVDVGGRFGGLYPTDAQLVEVQRTDCFRAFQNYVGSAPTPDLGVGVYGPSAATWDDPARRYVVCLVSAPTNQGNVLTDSARKRD